MCPLDYFCSLFNTPISFLVSSLALWLALPGDRRVPTGPTPSRPLVHQRPFDSFACRSPQPACLRVFSGQGSHSRVRRNGACCFASWRSYRPRVPHLRKSNTSSAVAADSSFAQEILADEFRAGRLSPECAHYFFNSTRSLIALLPPELRNPAWSHSLLPEAPEYVSPYLFSIDPS